MPAYAILCPLLTPGLKILRARGTYVIGRDAKCDIVIASDVISRRHVELQWTLSGGFIIRDKKSANGTRVNGVPLLQPQLLKDGDLVELGLGPFQLRFREYEGDLQDLMPQGTDAAETAPLRADELRALTKRAEGGAPPVAMGGAFAETELLEVIRLVAQGDRSGVLTVRADGVEGQIGFEKGVIVRARVADRSGEEAAHRILSTKKGRFELVEGPLTLAPNCRLKVEPLILEVARLLDHAGAPLPKGVDDTPIMPSLMSRPGSGDATRQIRPQTFELLDEAPGSPSGPPAAPAPPRDTTPERGTFTRRLTKEPPRS